MKNILTIIDVQNSFLSSAGILSIPNGEDLIKLINNFIEQLYLNASNKDKHIFESILITQDTHFKEEYMTSEEGKLFPLHCQYNTKDWDLCFNVDIFRKNKQTHNYLLKNEFDMWADKTSNNYNEKLFAVLNSSENIQYSCLDQFMVQNDYLPQNTNIYLFGVSSDYCVKYAINGYLENNYKVYIFEDLTLGIEKDMQQTCIEHFNKYLGTKLFLINSNSFLAR